MPAMIAAPEPNDGLVPVGDSTIGTPLILEDRLVTSDDQKGITAWRIRSDGDAWTLRQLWHVPTVSPGGSGSTPPDACARPL